MIILDELPWSLALSTLYVIPVAMLASCAPHRPRLAFRGFFALAAVFLYTLFAHVTLVNIPAPSLYNLLTYLPSIVLWGGMVALLIILSRWCYLLSIWAAAFCGTCGYIAQNMTQVLGNILAELFQLLGYAVQMGRFERSILGVLPVYALYYVLLARKVRSTGLEEIANRRMFLMVFAVLLVNIISNMPFKDFLILDIPLQGVIIMQVLLLTTSILMIVLEFELLVNQRTHASLAATRRLLKEQARHYELSKRNIEAINIKCHDIKHQIHKLEARTTVESKVFDDLAKEITVYDCSVQTGNEALDTVLTEKRFLCEHDNIVFTCVADGTVLSHMAAADIYALFGNMLDNAIEAEQAIQPTENRSISLSIRCIAGMASIHLENYFVGDANFVDGLPRTTKKDALNHGFGVRSIQMIVSRYGGTLSMGTENDTFYVNVLLPITK